MNQNTAWNQNKPGQEVAKTGQALPDTAQGGVPRAAPPCFRRWTSLKTRRASPFLPTCQA